MKVGAIKDKPQNPATKLSCIKARMGKAKGASVSI